MSPYTIISTRLQALATEAEADNEQLEQGELTLEQMVQHSDQRLIDLYNIRVWFDLQDQAEQAK